MLNQCGFSLGETERLKRCINSLFEKGPATVTAKKSGGKKSKKVSDIVKVETPIFTE